MWKILMHDPEAAFATILYLLITLLLNSWTRDTDDILDQDTLGTIDLSKYGTGITHYGQFKKKNSWEREDPSTAQNFQSVTKNEHVAAGFQPNCYYLL